MRPSPSASEALNKSLSNRWVRCGMAVLLFVLLPRRCRAVGDGDDAAADPKPLGVRGLPGSLPEESWSNVSTSLRARQSTAVVAYRSCSPARKSSNASKETSKRRCRDTPCSRCGKKSTSDSRLCTRARGRGRSNCPPPPSALVGATKGGDCCFGVEVGRRSTTLSFDGRAVRQWMMTCAPSEGSSCICVSLKCGGRVVVSAAQNSTFTHMSAAISLA
mmetsp:Transcript_57376/g.115170  ORF Transcript_57376/g.115170 Transcript_57376/m.115170 type:complete len:218 (+) Transcript_57376:2371-3024(+)